jgi:hypothetical protein
MKKLAAYMLYTSTAAKSSYDMSKEFEKNSDYMEYVKAITSKRNKKRKGKKK